MANVTDLFNPGGAELKPVSTELYKPSYKDGKGGVYKAIIRFVPFYGDPVNKSIVYKKVAFVKNPLTGQGIYVDNPRTVREFSPMSEAFSKLWNTGSEANQKIAKEFLGSKDQYASLVQIIEDEQHPELKGQIKVLTYGSKLWTKLNTEEHPAAGTGYNPFHPSRGRYFSLVITGQDKFNNYDQSMFFDIKDASGNVLPSGVWYLNPASGQIEACTDNTDPQALMDYLTANSPDLLKYDYQPMTADQTKFVNDAIAAIFQKVSGAQGALQTLGAPAPTPAGNLQVNTAPVFPGAVPAAPAAPAPAPAAPVTEQAARPAPAGFGGVSLGQPSVAPAPASVVGVQLPNVAPAAAPTQAPAPGLGINVADILKNL